jgi:hypothetical protein
LEAENAGGGRFIRERTEYFCPAITGKFRTACGRCQLGSEPRECGTRRAARFSLTHISASGRNKAGNLTRIRTGPRPSAGQGFRRGTSLPPGSAVSNPLSLLFPLSRALDHSFCLFLSLSLFLFPSLRLFPIRVLGSRLYLSRADPFLKCTSLPLPRSRREIRAFYAFYIRERDGCVSKT